MSKLRIYRRLLKEGSLFAISALVTNRLRTLLSLLGVTIGIFLIISVFTLVDSLESGIRETFDSLGDDAVFIEKMPWGPEPGDETYAWWRYMQRPDITLEEAKMLESRMTTAKAVTFLGTASRSIERRSSSVSNASIVAVSEGFENFVVVEIKEGRNFTPSELQLSRRICILGHSVAEELFGMTNPIGKTVKIAGYKTAVIGVLEKEGQGGFGNGVDEWAIIPVQFGRMVMNLNKGNTKIALKPAEFIDQKVMENEALMHLRSLRGLRPSEDRNFAMNRSSMLNQGMDQIFGLLTIAGLIIGGFSILVGGFSIANIMFVSVRERTNIIGIQKALGAKKDFILFQFLFESIFLCVMGGLVGLFIIWLCTLVASTFTDFDLVLTWWNIAIGMMFSVGIGLISGIVPASMAAKMEPVEAIRANA